jgi:pSer/pThr/pTyr-binding forkhead associated (FHA) protein
MPSESLPTSVVAHAELVVRNGRQRGAKRPLRLPVTIIGSAPGCDIRLVVDSVRPVHCVIANGPQGAHIRSWGATDTFVNGTAILDQPLRDGDVLAVGPFEFELHLVVPLAQAVDESSPPAEEDREERYRELRLQLAAARFRFRREKVDHEAEVERVERRRDDLEYREAQVERERLRLSRLRQRFLKHWKKRWSAARMRHDAAAEQFARERTTFDTENAASEEQRAKFKAHAEVEERRIEHGWETLRAAQISSQKELAKHREEFDQRELSLAERAAALQTESHQLAERGMQIEHHSAQLRIEADGLESRVVNLRAILLQLEAQRAQCTQSAVGSIDIPEINAAAELPNSASTEARRRELERVAEELADQRRVLGEQIDRLALAREQWRTEEQRLVAEMADDAERLRIREDQIAEHEAAVNFERAQLEKERGNLEQLREGLEIDQARAAANNTVVDSKQACSELELRMQAHQLNRRETALTELCRRWTARRGKEIEQLRTELRRSEKLRMEWTEQRSQFDRQIHAVAETQREQAVQALILERVIQKLLNDADDPLVAQKRLERLDRHLRKALEKGDAELTQRWRTLIEERERLDRLYRESATRIEEAAAAQRLLADRTAETERREYRLTEKEIALAEQLTVWKAQQAIYERERAELRLEIDRLAGLLIESEAPILPLARAA